MSDYHYYFRNSLSLNIVICVSIFHFKNSSRKNTSGIYEKIKQHLKEIASTTTNSVFAARLVHCRSEFAKTPIRTRRASWSLPCPRESRR